MITRKGLVSAGILLFWAVMTGWLLRYEVFPDFFTQAVAGYRSLMADGPLIMDSWMSIQFNGQPVGYSHTRVNTSDRNLNEQYLIFNRTALNLNLLGQNQPVAVIATATLDSFYRLQRFDFSMQAEVYRASISGRRRAGRVFDIRINTGSLDQRTEMEIPDDVIIYFPWSETALRRLEPGQQIRMRTLDPALLTVSDVLVKALRREVLQLGTNAIPTTVFALNLQGMELLSWMDENGVIVRQTTPFGWVMEACPPGELLMQMSAREGGADFLRALSVPARGALDDPRAARRIRVLFRGLPVANFELESERQHVGRASPLETELTVRAQALPPPPGAPSPEALRPWLEPSVFIQSGHPDIVRQARQITAGLTNRLDQVLALNRWVHGRIAKNPAVSLPSALDVLRRREGDCNEHTYLFVALARAVGIPAQVRVGLVYLPGGFFYHAWPAVYVNGWVELDPTLGQDAVDAAHISLLEGEVGSQIRILALLGQVSAEILETDYD